MKKLFTVILLFLLSLSFAQPVLAQQDIVVRQHKINLLVKEDGIYQFTHTLDVDFLAPYRGIYVNIPQEYDMNWEVNGEIVNQRYVFPIRNITVFNETHVINRSRAGVSIRIGDENTFITGLKTYTYSYTMHTSDLKLNDEQLFYLNLLGDQWEIPTEKVDFVITFHKSVSNLTPLFYAGSYGQTNNNGVVFNVSDNIISGSTTVSLNPYEALTIFLDVPNDFFLYKPSFDLSWIALVYGLLLLVLTIFLFFKHGKDEPPVPTVQFTAPKGLSSAQVGYIYDGFVDQKDLLSLIIFWAANGYLTIEELDKNDVLLTKLKDLPPESINAERLLFNELFKTGDAVSTESLKYKFHAALAVAKTNLERYFTTNKSRRVYSRTADMIQIAFAFLLPSMLALITFISVYQYTFYVFESIVAAGIVWLFGIITSGIVLIVARRLHTNKAFKRTMSVLVLAVITFTYSFVVYLINITYESTFVAIALLIGFISSLTINAFMHKRTEVGLAWYNDIIGLRNFIEVAEKDRLEMLVRDDPEYFYHILPYAYVLNITNVWSKKFESIAIEPPSWYVGSQPVNSYIFMRTLNRSLNTMSKTMMAPPPTKSGRGGGSSGGSGGGFSGGGFGGGGGGGW